MITVDVIVIVCFWKVNFSICKQSWVSVEIKATPACDPSPPAEASVPEGFTWVQGLNSSNKGAEGHRWELSPQEILYAFVSLSLHICVCVWLCTATTNSKWVNNSTDENEMSETVQISPQLSRLGKDKTDVVMNRKIPLIQSFNPIIRCGLQQIC